MSHLSASHTANLRLQRAEVNYRLTWRSHSSKNSGYMKKRGLRNLKKKKHMKKNKFRKALKMFDLEVLGPFGLI